MSTSYHYFSFPFSSSFSTLLLSDILFKFDRMGINNLSTLAFSNLCCLGDSGLIYKLECQSILHCKLRESIYI